METCFDYTDREVGYFSSDERRFITKVRRLKEQYPEEVRIIAESEENDGCIYCELPSAWFTIRVPKKRVLTEEERQELSDRMKRVHRERLSLNEYTRKNESNSASTASDE